MKLFISLCRIFGDTAERMGERAQRFVDALSATAARYYYTNKSRFIRPCCSTCGLTKHW